MPKTIFGKLVAMFVFILALAFIITGITLNYFLNNFLTQEKAASMKKNCEIIYRITQNYLTDTGDPLAEFYFQAYLSMSSSLSGSGSYIWVVDETGHILLSEPKLPPELILKYGDSTGYVKLPVENQYKKVMNQPDVVKEQGDFFGFFKERAFVRTGQDAARLTIERSFVYSPSIGKQRMYAIYMHTPVPEVLSARKSVLKFYMFSVATAVLISIILVYAFSLRLTRPLKEIKNAAKTIAGGEFKKRLNIKTQDEIGQLAQSFDQMAVALQNIEKMRRDFVANVSHELRTPMTSIRGFIDGILDGTIPSERQNYYLNIVKDETDRLNRLVNNLLDLAKMEAGEIEITPRIVNINELIRICVIKLETLILNKRIQVEAMFEEENMFVSADVDAIERVLYNLVHNAIKFTPEEGRITISTARKKDKVEISVEDTGIGINPDEIRLIWDRFYKTDKSRSRDKVGTGLGLAIVKTIISEHNQDIWVRSEPGKGTVFTFTLRWVEKSEN